MQSPFTTHHGASVATRIVIVGGGQSARWLLFHLAEQMARAPQDLGDLHITVVERGNQFGTGLAWDREHVLEAHLASRADRVTRWHYGDQQRKQFTGTAEFLRELGAEVTMIGNDEVVDIGEDPHGFVLTLASGRRLTAHYTILATGYGGRPWRGKATKLDQPALATQPRVHRSPWPAHELQEAVLGTPAEGGGKRILLLGSYLTAIDTAVALALRAGRFVTDAAGQLHYEAAQDFHICMASRSGLLPAVWGRDTDQPWAFQNFTESAVKGLLESTATGEFIPMRSTMRLLAQELSDAARTINCQVPVALRKLNDPMRRLRAFAKLMARRDPAALLRQHLNDVLPADGAPASYATLRTVGWQAPIDRAIALWSECSPWFPAEEVSAFDAHLKTIFFNYMLPMTLDSALHLEAMLRSGHLSIIALGNAAALTPSTDAPGRFMLRRSSDGEVRYFSDIVDATGQDWDLNRSSSALLCALHERRIVQPSWRPYRDYRKAGAVKNKPEVREHGGGHFLRGAGVHVNPRTCEAIPADYVDLKFSRPAGKGLYAMGPNLSGQFADAQSLGQAQRDAARIVANMCEKRTQLVEAPTDAVY